MSGCFWILEQGGFFFCFFLFKKFVIACLLYFPVFPAHSRLPLEFSMQWSENKRKLWKNSFTDSILKIGFQIPSPTSCWHAPSCHYSDARLIITDIICLPALYCSSHVTILCFLSSLGEHICGKWNDIKWFMTENWQLEALNELAGQLTLVVSL